MFDTDKIKYYNFPSILSISSQLHSTHLFNKMKNITFLYLSLLLFFDNIKYKK